MNKNEGEFCEGIVSVVTPVYNGEFHLARMLESILNQTYDFVDMILVDDGSTDRTVAVAESYCEKFAARGYGYRIIRAEHCCASAAINQGLPYVNGEYLIWPDSDDVLEPESVKTRVRFLKEHPQYQCVRSLSYYFNAETGELSERADEKTGDLSKENLFWDILESKTFVCCGCYMLRSEKFFEIYPNRHIPEYNVGQNFQMLLPFMYRYPCPTIQEKLYGVFMRKGSHSRRYLTKDEELKKYRDYEKLIDEIALICKIKDRKSKKHIMLWKANRRQQIAWKYDRKDLLASAWFQLYRCGHMKLFHMLKGCVWACFHWTMEPLFEIKQQVETNEVDWIHFCRKKMVALTFDVSWGNEYTELILRKLKQNEIKATFFISGIWLEKYREDFQKIFEDGHEIGNHSYHHPHMINLSEEEILREIFQTEQVIREVTGQEEGILFRFPYGERNKGILKLIRKRGFLSVNWSIDSKDWKGISAEEIYQKIMKENINLRNGAVILMHNSGEHTAEALDLIIPALREKDYEIVLVSDLLNTVPLYRYKVKRRKRNKKSCQL